MSEWIKTAKAGDKVVCVLTWTDAEDRTGTRDEVGPVSGETYTIREIGFFHPDHPEILAIRLVEILNPVRKYRYGYGENVIVSECCFAAYRFRPVQPRQTDISIFTDMLKKADKPVKEVV